MAYEIRPETGSLFKNTKKTTDNHPGMTGSALINGVEYWVSAWTKEGANGRWQSLAFKRKDDSSGASNRVTGKPKDDSDLPF